MATSAAALKSSPAVNDAVLARITPQKKEAAKVDTRFADIAANPFYKIMFSEGKPEEKRAALAKALSFEGTKLQNREKIAAFEMFKEYLSSVREEMAKEIIKLTDTDAFSTMQDAHKQNDIDLHEYEEAMKPLMDILDAIYVLDTNGKMSDAFRNIRNDKEQEERIKTRTEEIKSAVDTVSKEIDRRQLAIAEAKRQKSFFGLGSITPEAQRDIDENQLAIEKSLRELDAIKAEQQALIVPADAGREFAAETAKLRELLDLTSDDHKDRQKSAVSKALKFCENSRERLIGLRAQFDKMSGQINNLAEANGQIHMVYAVMNEGIGDAAKVNTKIRQDALAVPPNEDSMQKLTREQTLADVETHISTLDESRRDTELTYADLTRDRVRIKDMKSANDGQLQGTRALQTRGVAGVASQISTVLQGVSQAALTQSASITKNTLIRMEEKNDEYTQKGSIRLAMGVDAANEDVMRAIKGISSYGETLRVATQLERTGWTEIQANLQRLREVGQEATDALRESHGVRADVDAGATPTSGGKKPAAAPSPFKLGAA